MNYDIFSAVLSDGLLAAVAAIGFAVISNPPKRAVIVSALLAAIGHGCRFYLIKNGIFDLTLATFIAAFIIGILSMGFAKIIRCPAEVFAFPSLLPMIPGMFAYRTILSLMRFMQAESGSEMSWDLLEQIFRNGLTTVFVMFSMVVGVILPMFIFHRQSFMMTRLLGVDRKKH